MSEPKSDSTDPLTVEADGLGLHPGPPAHAERQKIIITCGSRTACKRPRSSTAAISTASPAPRARRARRRDVRADARHRDGTPGAFADRVERLAATAKKPESIVLTAARKAAAEKLLARPDLLSRVSLTLAKRGLVGEERNRRLCYLVATSRLLDRPLSAILRAARRPGSPEILDRVAELLRPSASSR